ncbi:armadillo-type protein [Phlyctochytrium arcticum]|nr:armadillo-type protein [Phlyctochytrium arcticum]
MTISIDAVNLTDSTLPATPETYQQLAAILHNTITPPPALAARFRALFQLKALNTPESIDIIAQTFVDPSALLKHELAYVLGQMRNTHAIPCLEGVLRDLKEDPMVRHEAAEALGAIAQVESLPILEQYKNDKERVVRETCELAVERIKYEQDRLSKGEAAPPSRYASVDPAPPSDEGKAAKEAISTEDLAAQLMDDSLPLFTRYRAMFALRNRGDVPSVLALARGLLEDDSALFRHEVAYVFGQLQHPASVPALIKSLSNQEEISMVRHECAEALGSIAVPECLDALKEFAKDSDQVVRESCVVGLDMFEFETEGH